MRFLAFMLLAIAVRAQTLPSPTPVYWLPFGNGVTVTQDLDRISASIVTGSTVYAATGLFGAAISATNASASTIVLGTNSAASMAGRSEFTISFWFRPSSYAAANRNVYSDVVSGFTRAGLWQFSGNLLIFVHRTADTGTRFDLSTAATGATFTGKWTHVAMVYSVSRSEKSIYFNGIRWATTNANVFAMTSTRSSEVRLGSLPSVGFAEGLPATWDDFAVYTNAMTSNQVYSIYTITKRRGVR